MVCVFKHLYCSAQLSMSNMEKRYRNKIIIISGTSATGKAGIEPWSAALEADVLPFGQRVCLQPVKADVLPFGQRVCLLKADVLPFGQRVCLLKADVLPFGQRVCLLKADVLPFGQRVCLLKADVLPFDYSQDARTVTQSTSIAPL